jgi:hypothetical protein
VPFSISSSWSFSNAPFDHEDEDDLKRCVFRLEQRAPNSDYENEQEDEDDFPWNVNQPESQLKAPSLH